MKRFKLFPEFKEIFAKIEFSTKTLKFEVGVFWFIWNKLQEIVKFEKTVLAIKNVEFSKKNICFKFFEMSSKSLQRHP